MALPPVLQADNELSKTRFSGFLLREDISYDRFAFQHESEIGRLDLLLQRRNVRKPIDFSFPGQRSGGQPEDNVVSHFLTFELPCGASAIAGIDFETAQDIFIGKTSNR